MQALYLGLDVMTAVKEANQGFAHKIDPCVLCTYEVACDDIADLRTTEARAEQLVRRFSQIDGYRCLSLIRALAVVNCQSALA